MIVRQDIQLSLCVGYGAPKTGECRPDPSSLDWGPSSEIMGCWKGEYMSVSALATMMGIGNDNGVKVIGCPAE